MMHVVMIAMAIFVNNATGEAQMASAPVTGPLECAKLINESHVIQGDDGSTWTMTDAICMADYE